MNILVTGATGFIGSAFARLALERGHAVAGLALPSERLPGLLDGRPGLRWLRGTLADFPWPELQAFAADVAIHSAWITTPGVYLESPENRQFLQDSLRFCRRLRDLGIGHLVGVGSCVEYGATDQPRVEDVTPVQPATLYARCKDDLRRALEAETTAGTTLAWARVFYPYGPGEHPSRLCSAIADRLLRGEAVVLQTPDSTKDYIFIEDLAAALLTVVERRFQGCINLGTGVGVPVRALARELGRQVGHPELVTEASPPKADPLGHVVADTTRLRALGWTPRTPLAAGLQKLLASRRSALQT